MLKNIKLYFWNVPQKTNKSYLLNVSRYSFFLYQSISLRKLLDFKDLTKNPLYVSLIIYIYFVNNNKKRIIFRKFSIVFIWNWLNKMLFFRQIFEETFRLFEISMSLLRQIDKIETFRQSVGCASVNWPLYTSGRGKLENWSQCLQTSLRISYFAGIHLSNFSIFFLLVIVSCWSFCISISFSICSTWFFSFKHEIFGRIFLIFFLPYLLYVIVWFLADRKGLLLDNHHQRKHLFELFSLFRVFFPIHKHLRRTSGEVQAYMEQKVLTRQFRSWHPCWSGKVIVHLRIAHIFNNIVLHQPSNSLQEHSPKN